MKLFLDDVRTCPFVGNWIVARNFDEAVEAMNKYDIEEAWLDHDLAEDHYVNLNNPGYVSPNKTGYDFVLWMRDNKKWPTNLCMVHSMNPVGSRKMCEVISEHYCTPNPMYHYLRYDKLVQHVKSSRDKGFI